MPVEQIGSARLFVVNWVGMFVCGKSNVNYVYEAVCLLVMNVVVVIYGVFLFCYSQCLDTLLGKVLCVR